MSSPATTEGDWAGTPVMDRRKLRKGAKVA